MHNNTTVVFHVPSTQLLKINRDAGRKRKQRYYILSYEYMNKKEKSSFDY
jgi:hypothetical protein